MLTSSISALTISYNSPDLIDTLLSSLRRHYDIPITIVDGSEAPHYQDIEQLCRRYANVTLHHFDYNIHHGPGMAWAISNLQPQGPLLVLDSDVEVLRHGFLELMASALEVQMYGVGDIQYVDKNGRNVAPDSQGIPYLHPACMLCNPNVVRQWPLPIKHGAPMIEAMIAIHHSNQSHLLGNLPWIGTDFCKTNGINEYLRHDWQGTVRRTGGYHLEKILVDEEKQTPSPTVEVPKYNRDLKQLIPAGARHIVEVGCNNGALARAYKADHPDCHYVGVDINPDSAEIARQFCDEVYALDIEAGTDEFISKCRVADTWIFGDVLEHLRDPWALLAKIRQTIPAHGCLVICLPNIQHWSIQANLSVGDWKYQAWGLLDRTHLRFFTRITLLEMITQAGYRLDTGYPRIFGEPVPAGVTHAIKTMAAAMGKDPEQAYQDCLPTQYVLRIVPT